MSSLGARRLAFLLLSAAWLAGCGGEGTNSSSPPTISQFQAVMFDNTKDTLRIDSTLRLSGKVVDGDGLKGWILTLLDNTGKILDTIDASKISGANFVFDQPNSNLLVRNDGSWGPSGSYTLRLTVTDTFGEASRVDLKFYAIGSGSGTDTLVASQGTAILGAQGAIEGSFLDVTRDSVWTSGSKPYDHIDVVFGVDATSNLSLMSPSLAVSDGFNLSGWTTLNTTVIVFSATPLRTTTAIKAAIGVSPFQQKVPAQIGWYAVKLSTGAYAALRLSAPTSANSTATANVEIFK